MYRKTPTTYENECAIFIIVNFETDFTNCGDSSSNFPLISLFLLYCHVLSFFYTHTTRALCLLNRFFFSSIFPKNISAEKTKVCIVAVFFYDFFGALASVHCCSAITMTFEHNEI